MSTASKLDTGIAMCERALLFANYPGRFGYPAQTVRSFLRTCRPMRRNHVQLSSNSPLPEFPLVAQGLLVQSAVSQIPSEVQLGRGAPVWTWRMGQNAWALRLEFEKSIAVGNDGPDGKHTNGLELTG
jgi:hypothetical protein